MRIRGRDVRAINTAITTRNSSQACISGENLSLPIEFRTNALRQKSRMRGSPLCAGSRVSEARAARTGVVLYLLVRDGFKVTFGFGPAPIEKLTHGT